jgi:hypothetical protein
MLAWDRAPEDAVHRGSICNHPVTERMERELPAAPDRVTQWRSSMCARFWRSLPLDHSGGPIASIAISMGRWLPPQSVSGRAIPAPLGVANARDLPMSRDMGFVTRVLPLSPRFPQATSSISPAHFHDIRIGRMRAGPVSWDGTLGAFLPRTSSGLRLLAGDRDYPVSASPSPRPLSHADCTTAIARSPPNSS